MKKIVVFLAIGVSLILLLGSDGSNLKLQDTECKCKYEPGQWAEAYRQNVSKYAIVRASELDDLQTDVNNKLKTGWHLIGGISIVDSNSVCQVMVK